MPPERMEESEVMTPPCSVISFTDTELMALIHGAMRRLVVIAPGLSESVAKALIERWHALGPTGVHVVLDPDPEVCRLGYGELTALTLLQAEAERIGSTIHQQQGLRIGVVVTDETTAIFAPTPLLIEAGGRPGEKPNAIQFEMPILDPTGSASASDLGSLSLNTKPVLDADVQKTSQDLAANPPVKFDVAQKVRVFNARIEFVEFELRGLSVSRKTVRIPPDIMGLAKEPKAQKLLTSSAHLIADNTELSGDRVNKLKQFIAEKYLITLPGYGTAILRSNKTNFQVAVKALEKYVRRFQKVLAQKLQAAMDANRELLVTAFLPSVIASPPGRWKRLLGDHPSGREIERLLRTELTKAFGSSQALIREMSVKAVFKGVTYESLNDPEFMRIAGKKIPSLEVFHDEYDAAKAQGQLEI
jgi:hypothetical protein